MRVRISMTFFDIPGTPADRWEYNGNVGTIDSDREIEAAVLRACIGRGHAKKGRDRCTFITIPSPTNPGKREKITGTMGAKFEVGEIGGTKAVCWAKVRTLVES